MSVKSLQAIIGIFFVILGITGISPTINEGVFSINNGRYFIEALFGIFELVCGAIMLFGLISNVKRKNMHTAITVVLIFWLGRVLFSSFIWGFPDAVGLNFLMNWMLILCVDAIVASAVWLLSVSYQRG